MTTTIEPTEVDGPPVDPWAFAEPATAPEPAAKPAHDDLTPALRMMVEELCDVYGGADCPSIDKTAERMKAETGSKSWDSRGQVDKARTAYRARYGITPPAKKTRTTPAPAARTKPATPRRTAVVRTDPAPVVRDEPAPVVQPPVPSQPPVVHADPVPQPTPAVQTSPAGRAVAWPVILLAAPAFVAIWSGWVGLGGLTGFGVVHPLPGIWDSLQLNTAITLPVGVETYGAYALYVWLSGRVPARARRFAKWSAIASLAVGALGQVAYHLLAASGVTAAPWQITTAVSCLPVAVLGMGAALAHLVREED